MRSISCFLIVFAIKIQKEYKQSFLFIIADKICYTLEWTDFKKSILKRISPQENTMKIIITDLDRTLLHTDKTISDYTKEILQKCRQQGWFVMAATARPVRAIKTYMRAVHFNAVTTMNGARTILMDGTVDHCISVATAKQIIEKLMTINDAIISLETEEGLLANIDIPEWQPTVYENLLTAPLPEKIFKIIVSSNSINLDNFIPSILTDDVYCSVADGTLFQIMSTEATKWNGIQSMLNEYALSPEDVIYFGDDNDDIESMQKCGLGIAVSNAIQPVLDIADLVIDSNDNDGVAKYIEKILDK